MIKLLKKEMCFSSMKLTYVFLAFSVMFMLPNYPILVGGYFICLGLFYSFQYSRESNDILYTALLPVKKSDVVRAKFTFCIVVQGIGFAAMSVFTALRYLLRANEPYASTVLMPANLITLAWVSIVFALFNTIFLTGFFKTGYKIGKPLILFSIAAFITVGLCETLPHLPSMSVVGQVGGEGIWLRSVTLLLGLGVYAVSTYAALKRSIYHFDRVDL